MLFTSKALTNISKVDSDKWKLSARHQHWNLVARVNKKYLVLEEGWQKGYFAHGELLSCGTLVNEQSLLLPRRVFSCSLSGFNSINDDCPTFGRIFWHAFCALDVVDPGRVEMCQLNIGKYKTQYFKRPYPLTFAVPVKMYPPSVPQLCAGTWLLDSLITLFIRNLHQACQL